MLCVHCTWIILVSARYYVEHSCCMYIVPVLLHMADAFFIIPQSAVEYCGIAFSLLYCMGVLQNSTTVELCGMSRFFVKLH